METKCCIYESPTENKSVYDRTAKELCIRSNPTTILKRKNYFTVRCCGLPMKRMIVQMVYPIVKFSGGERQRLVLARAILRKPSILVLDEATSALDTENESKIQASLERLKGQMTIIVIAHRLSTIRNADQVIVLDQGEIIQQGSFHQLAGEQKGMFNHLLKKQMEVSV
jgi:ABC-type multidrug transport system ATPase subunit